MRCDKYLCDPLAYLRFTRMIQVKPWNLALQHRWKCRAVDKEMPIKKDRFSQFQHEYPFERLDLLNGNNLVFPPDLIHDSICQCRKCFGVMKHRKITIYNKSQVVCLCKRNFQKILKGGAYSEINRKKSNVKIDIKHIKGFVGSGTRSINIYLIDRALTTLCWTTLVRVQPDLIFFSMCYVVYLCII